MVKKISEKRVGSVTYKLKLFEEDGKYVIYKIDDSVVNSGEVHQVPEEAVFDNEKDARGYFRKL